MNIKLAVLFAIIAIASAARERVLYEAFSGLNCQAADLGSIVVRFEVSHCNELLKACHGTNTYQIYINPIPLTINFLITLRVSKYCTNRMMINLVLIVPTMKQHRTDPPPEHQSPKPNLTGPTFPFNSPSALSPMRWNTPFTLVILH
jgi:hypothetical protein